ncbi:MAG: ATP-binding protein [Candidatus Dojkabacteria bacterium]
MFTIPAFPELGAIVAIACLLFAIASFFFSQRSRSNLFFALSTISAGIWIVVNTVVLPTVTENLDPLVKVSFVFGHLTLILIWCFAYYFTTNNLSKSFRTIHIFNILITVFSIVFVIVSQLIVTKSYYIGDALILEYGPLYILESIAFLFVFIITIVYLFRQFRIAEGLSKNQLRLFLVGFGLTASISLLTNLIYPFISKDANSSRVGPLGVIFYIAFTFYAVVRYRFLDIKLFIGRFTYYFVLSLIVLIAYRIVLLSNNFIWGSALDIRGMLTGAVFAFVFVAFYDNFKVFIQSRINSVLINPGFEPNEVIVNFNKTISTLLDYEEIAELLDQTILKTIRPNLISVFVKLEEKDKIILKTQSTENEVALNYNNIYKLWENSAYIPIFLDQIELEVPRKFSSAFHELSLVVEEMRQKKIKLILPIGMKENSNGILILGSKEGDSPYNTVQIKYIESLCEITALALMRAKLYEEVQEFNETLQQKVKDATLEVQSQNSKLSEALKVERDMLDVLGHELRTPLGTIRNAMGVMDLKYKNKQFTDTDLEGFLKIGTENIRREIQLLETILASAKIDNDKLDMNFEKVDSNDVIADSFEAYKYDAEKKGIKLIVTLPKEVVYSYADRLRIQQVMDNLVSNSIKYTLKGQVELKLADEGKYVRFSVSDTGEGIPEEDIAKLGTKFFRANMYLKSDGKIGDRRIVRPGGTGIGLYVVYQIVKYMYGEVKVTSKLGEGSTFSFTVLKHTDALEDKNSFILTGKNSVRTYNDETRESVF